MANFITRKDDDFDSIAWAFSEHVRKRDNKRFKSAILHGNEDSPSKIEFFTQAMPNYDTKPAWVWTPKEENRGRSRARRNAGRGKRVMRTYDLYWAPEGRKIATVVASTARAAKRKAPTPYRRFLGEIYAVEVGAANSGRAKSSAKSSGWIPAKAFRLLNSGAVQVKVSKGRVERRGNPVISTSKSWARQKVEEDYRYQVSIHHPRVPTRVFRTLAEARKLVARAKGNTYKGTHYDIYDRETGEFLASGVL